MQDIVYRVVSYLNKKAFKNFKADTKKTIDLIKLRLSEGYTEEDYQKMSIVEKRILSNYKQFTEDYDPLAEGLFESWNWNSDLDL